MIGNLILALGIACLSASAIHTDNFNHVYDTDNVIINNSFGYDLYSDEVSYFYDENVGKNRLTVFDIDFHFKVDANNYIHGSTYGYSFPEEKCILVDDIGHRSDEIYSSAINNDMSFGFSIFSTSETYYHLVLFVEMKTYSFTNTDNETFYFKNNMLNFNLEGGFNNDHSVTYRINNTLLEGLPYVNNVSNQYNGLPVIYKISDSLTYNGTQFLLLPFVIECDLVANRDIHLRMTSYSYFDDGETYTDGFNNGYATGYKDGESNGWRNGYAEGLNVSSGANADIKNLFGVLADTPIRFLKDMFSFELFGMNVAVVILSCLTAIVMFTLIKKIWK